MKTISNGKEVLRVDEYTADLKVKTDWKYVPKNQWKTQVRDLNKKEKEKKVAK